MIPPYLGKGQSLLESMNKKARTTSRPNKLSATMQNIQKLQNDNPILENYIRKQPPTHNNPQQIPTQPTERMTDDSPNRLFFHIEYHNRDISRKTIHKIYHSSFEQNSPTTCDICIYNKTPTKLPMNITQLTIAYSRNKNHFDTLCSSTLHEHNTTVSHLLQEKNETTHRWEDWLQLQSLTHKFKFNLASELKTKIEHHLYA